MHCQEMLREASEGTWGGKQFNKNVSSCEMQGSKDRTGNVCDGSGCWEAEGSRRP